MNAPRTSLPAAAVQDGGYGGGRGVQRRRKETDLFTRGEPINVNWKIELKRVTFVKVTEDCMLLGVGVIAMATFIHSSTMSENGNSRRRRRRRCSHPGGTVEECQIWIPIRVGERLNTAVSVQARRGSPWKRVIRTTTTTTTTRAGCFTSCHCLHLIIIDPSKGVVPQNCERQGAKQQQQQLNMFRVRRKQHTLDHQDQEHRRDGEREDTAVKPEIPGTQASSSRPPPARKASQGTSPRQLTPLQLSALSEPWSPRKGGSLSGLRVSGGARSATAELPTASEILHRRGLVSRLYPARYQECGRPTKVETVVTNMSIKSTEFEDEEEEEDDEEEDEEDEEEESSSASTGLSHHPGPKTSVPLLGSDELCSLSALEQSTLLIIERLERESWTAKMNLLQAKFATVSLKDRCAADAPQSSDEPRLHAAADRPDGLNVDDVKTVFDPGEDAQADRSLKECCKEISCILKQSITNSPSAVTLREKDCSSGAQSATAELPTASEILHRRELVSRLHQYQDYGRPNKVETLLTNKSIKSTEFEEESEDDEEEEVEEEAEEEESSSSASTGLSHHPGPETTAPPDGGDELSHHLVQLSQLIIERLKMESAGIGRFTHTSSVRRKLLQWESTTVALQEDRRAADAPQSSVEPRHRRPEEDGLDVGDAKTFGEPEEHVQGRQAARLLELLCIRIQRLLEEKTEDEKAEADEDFCRTCHGTDSSPINPLTSPCRCKGSLKFIHIDCLKNWTRARIEMGLGPYSVQCCELCKGLMRLDPGTFNIQEFYRETQQQMLNNPERYPVLALLHRPSRLRRFVLRVRRWMTFRRS